MGNMRISTFTKLHQITLGSKGTPLTDRDCVFGTVNFQPADYTSTDEFDPRQPLLLLQVVQQVVQVVIGQHLISFKNGV
jgi:hypothetical protein